MYASSACDAGLVSGDRLPSRVPLQQPLHRNDQLTQEALDDWPALGKLVLHLDLHDIRHQGHKGVLLQGEWQRVSVCAFVLMTMRVHTCDCICLGVCTCICVSACVCVCVRVNDYQHVLECVSAHGCVSFCFCAYTVYVWVCVRVYMCVCTCE